MKCPVQFYLSSKFKDVWLLVLKNEAIMLIKKIFFAA